MRLVTSRLLLFLLIACSPKPIPEVEGQVRGRGYSSGDFALDVASGLKPGFYKVNKFGEATDCDNGVPTDIWDGADGTTSTDIWAPPTAARIHTLVSTSANDDVGGTGAITVRVDYLPDWSTKEKSETVTLDGVSGVAMTNAAVMINRMECLTWGSGGLNAGVITATAATDATVTSAILVGNNQTQQMIYGFPSGQTLQVSLFLSEVVRGAASTQKN